jgi:hypothetical protein
VCLPSFFGTRVEKFGMLEGIYEKQREGEKEGVKESRSEFVYFYIKDGDKKFL